MTRIDITTRDLHQLIAPVLPHASTDGELPALNCVHLQVTGHVLYAVATDRYTLAATRHPIDGFAEATTVDIDRTDAAAALKLFTFSKDEDPKLTLIIDTVAVPVSGLSVTGRALRIDAEDGTRLTLHDRAQADRNPFANWMRTVGKLAHRAPIAANPAILLSPARLPRWAKAAGKGERLAVFMGPEPGDPLLVTVEKYFIGVWAGFSDLEEQVLTLHGNPWRLELPKPAAEIPADDETEEEEED